MGTKKSETMKFLEETAGRPLTLGGLLESIRLSEEMSQIAFAKKLKASASHLCDIEKGRKVVSPERAARFARILGRSSEQFVRLSLMRWGARLCTPACACTDRYVRNICGEGHYHPCHRLEKCCRLGDPKPCECSRNCPCWPSHR